MNIALFQSALRTPYYIILAIIFIAYFIIFNFLPIDFMGPDTLVFINIAQQNILIMEARNWEFSQLDTQQLPAVLLTIYLYLFDQKIALCIYFLQNFTIFLLILSLIKRILITLGYSIEVCHIIVIMFSLLPSTIVHTLCIGKTLFITLGFLYLVFMIASRYNPILRGIIILLTIMACVYAKGYSTNTILVKVYNLHKLVMHVWSHKGISIANTNFDMHELPKSNMDIILRAPKGAMIGFLYPNPNQLIDLATKHPKNKVIYIVFLIEMLIYYFSYILVFLSFNKLDYRIKLGLFLATFCIVIYGAISFNLGYLHRVRFPFISLFFILGFAYLANKWHNGTIKKTA